MLVERRFAFLRRFFTLRTVFMHLADGDAALALRAAGYVERVYTNAFLNLGPRAPADAGRERRPPAPSTSPSAAGRRTRSTAASRRAASTSAAVRRARRAPS